MNLRRILWFKWQWKLLLQSNIGQPSYQPPTKLLKGCLVIGMYDWQYSSCSCLPAKLLKTWGWNCWAHSLKLVWVTSNQAYFVTHCVSVLGLPTVPCWAGKDHTQNNLMRPRGWTKALVNTWNRARADRFLFFAEESVVLCRWPRSEWEERIQFLPWTPRLSEDRLWLTAQRCTAPAAS